MDNKLTEQTGVLVLSFYFPQGEYCLFRRHRATTPRELPRVVAFALTLMRAKAMHQKAPTTFP